MIFLNFVPWVNPPRQNPPFFLGLFPSKLQIQDPKTLEHLHENIVDVDVLSWLVICFGGVVFLFKRRFLGGFKNGFSVFWLKCCLCSYAKLEFWWIYSWNHDDLRQVIFILTGDTYLRMRKKPRCLKIVWFTTQKGLSWRVSKLGLEIHCFPTIICILKGVLILPEFQTSQNRSKSGSFRAVLVAESYRKILGALVLFCGLEELCCHRFLRLWIEAGMVVGPNLLRS